MTPFAGAASWDNRAQVRRRSCGATRSRPHFENPAFTTPQITFGLKPLVAIRRSSTASLTQVGTGTVRTWPPLPMRSAITQFRPPEAAAEENRNHGVAAFGTQVVTTERGKESLALVNSQPIPDARSVFLSALDAPDSGRQVRTQKPTAGSLVREPANARRGSEQYQSINSRIA